MKFSELNDKQKEKAIDMNRYINVDDDSSWCDDVQCNFHSELESFGFNGVESQYSGFCSQGDGASFTADSVDIELFLRKTKRWSAYRALQEMIKINEIWCKVERNTSFRYVHSNSTEAVLYGENYIDLTPRQSELYEQLQKEIDDYITDKGDEYYNALSDHYYNLISDENVKSTIEANEMVFEEDPREPEVNYL